MKNAFFVIACMFSSLLSFGTDNAEKRISGVMEPETYVYFSVNGQSLIKIYKLDPINKALTPAGSITTSGQPFSLTTNSTKKQLFASLMTAKKASSFTINKNDGKLTLLNTVDIADDACYLSVSNNDKYLLSAYFGANKIAIFPIGGDGRINQTSTEMLTVPKWPHSIRTNPAGDIVYVPNMGGDLILQYSFNQETGKLTPLTPDRLTTPASTGPRHFTYHPSLNVVYFVTEVSSTVMAVKHDNKGLSAPFQTINNLPDAYAGKKWSSDIHITPNGKFLYVANRDHGTITGFTVNSTTGALTLIDRFATETIVREFDIDPSGKFLIAAGEKSGMVVLYEIAADGKLSSLNNYNLGTELWWVLALKMRTNLAPDNIILSASSLPANPVAGTLVGNLSTNDPDPEDKLPLYSIVSGNGSNDTDNALFDISGNKLVTKTSFAGQPKTSFNVYVQTEDGYGGTFKKAFVINIVASLVNSIKAATFEIFPNPFQNSFTIALNEPCAKGSTLKVFDANGRLVAQKKIDSNDSTISMDISASPKGKYFVQIQHGEEIQISKIISL